MQPRAKIEKLDKNNLSSQLINECLSIDQACFEDGVAYHEGTLRYYFSKYNVLLAKNNQNKVIGYLIFRNGDNEKAFHVTALAVHPNYQGLHVGKSLLENLHQEKSLNAITLECRPSNEPFYRKQGFKAVCLPKKQLKNINDDYYHLDFYHYANLRVHSIFMRKETNTSFPNNTFLPSQWITPDQEKYEIYRKQLLELAIAVKASTNIFYKGFFGRLFHRTERKEKAFDAIINELQALGNDKTKNRKISPTSILQAIAHDAMINRGYGLGKTSSGRALVKMLNDKKFQSLKQLLDKSDKKISYSGIRKFSAVEKNERSKSTPKPYSPYWHF